MLRAKKGISIMNRTALAAFVSAACLLLIAVHPLHAQAVANAQISGVISDPSGAPIAGAEVTVTQTATSQVRTARSGAEGA
jgi:hypothetical protein